MLLNRFCHVGIHRLAQDTFLSIDKLHVVDMIAVNMQNLSHTVDSHGLRHVFDS